VGSAGRSGRLKPGVSASRAPGPAGTARHGGVVWRPRCSFPLTARHRRLRSGIRALSKLPSCPPPTARRAAQALAWRAWRRRASSPFPRGTGSHQGLVAPACGRSVPASTSLRGQQIGFREHPSSDRLAVRLGLSKESGLSLQRNRDSARRPPTIPPGSQLATAGARAGSGAWPHLGDGPAWLARRCRRAPPDHTTQTCRPGLLPRRVRRMRAAVDGFWAREDQLHCKRNACRATTRPEDDQRLGAVAADQYRNRCGGLGGVIGFCRGLDRPSCSYRSPEKRPSLHHTAGLGRHRGPPGARRRRVGFS